jgi:hypothetical protein
MRTPASAKIPIPLRDEVTEERDVATYRVLNEWAANVVRTGEVADSGPPQGSEINLVLLGEAQARFPRAFTAFPEPFRGQKYLFLKLSGCLSGCVVHCDQLLAKTDLPGETFSFYNMTGAQLAVLGRHDWG